MPADADDPPPAAPPRVRLLAAPALLAPRELPFLPERRFRVAAYLALTPGGATRDELAALFWPERPQAAARSNLRKLLQELRRLDLPGLKVERERLIWPVDSDARDLLAGVAAADAGHPLPGLDGGDSAAWDSWLQAARGRLRDAWRDALLAPAPPAQALAAARRLLASDPEDEAARHAAESALRALGHGDARPASAPALVGRASELHQALALLDDPACRVLTLVGPGGIGKSTLALSVLRAHAGPLHWVALEDLADAAAVPARVAHELGLAIGAHSDGRAEVQARLVQRPCILLLDNAEHLGQPLAALLQPWLDAAPALRCLVTSRVPLRLAGEWLLPLLPLDDTAARRLFGLVAGDAAPGFDVAAAGPELEPLLARLGGMPLAIRLAAAWLRHLTLPALWREAQRSLAWLAQPASPDERLAHASVEATFALSWQLLPAPLQPALAALSVATSPLPMALACELAQAAPAQVATLAEASLVDLLPDGRVALHPLLREALLARLDAAAADAARDRLASAVVDAVRPWTGLQAFGSDAAIEALDTLQPLLRQAWAHALARAHAGWLMVLAAALSQLHQHRGGIGSVVEEFARAQQLPAVQADAAARGAIAIEHAALRYWRGEYDRAERAARVAVAAARVRRDAAGMAEALNTLAQICMRQGRLDEADARLARALAVAREAGDAASAAVFAGNLSAIRRQRGQPAAAAALAREALAGYRAEGNVDGEVGALNELGLLAHEAGDLDQAFDHYAQALVVLERDATSTRRAPLLTHQASVRLDQGRMAEALALAEASWALLHSLDMRSHEPPLCRVLAELLVAQGRLADARPYLHRAWVLTASQPASPALRGVVWSSAVFAAASGQAEVAARLAAHGLAGHAAPLPRYAALAARLGVAADQPLPGLADVLQGLLG